MARRWHFLRGSKIKRALSDWIRASRHHHSSNPENSGAELPVSFIPNMVSLSGIKLHTYQGTLVRALKFNRKITLLEELSSRRPISRGSVNFRL